MPEPEVDVDVLVVGGGPVGLSLAYQLRRFSMPPLADPQTTKPISVRVIEATPKPKQEAFGRAVTFWPRSVEMLSQLELGEPILQQCMAVRSSAAYDTKGNEVFGRGWSFLEGVSDTRYRFATVLRQRYVEDIFRAKLKALGVEVFENHKFLDLQVVPEIQHGEPGRVRAKVIRTDPVEGSEVEYTVNCRYLIGCDGSRTVVRGAAGIQSEGSRTEDKWVRVDGVLKHTTMPKPHSYGALESPIYGNVLWIPLDHGATRIGFSLKEERRKLYAEVNKDMYVKEAVLSVAPFEAEFERVDWASVYSVGQRLAKNFWANKSVFIAGDAAHSHSSGAGQGMNTGIHDSVNLGWKLAMVMTGTLRPEVLETYELERLPNAAKLIRYDEDISILISGRLPEGWTGSSDPNVALGEIFKEAAGFNTGLVIGYQPNMSVWSPEETRYQGQGSNGACLTIPAPAVPGYRAPDVELLLPGLWQSCWLQELTPNVAKFYVLTFIGTSPDGRQHLGDFKAVMASNDRIKTEPRYEGYYTSSGQKDATVAVENTRKWPVNFISVLPQKVGNAWNKLGESPLGKLYYDSDGGNAGRRYGVDAEKGAVFILRPDGFVGAVFTHDEDGAKDVVRYFERILL